MEEKRGIPVTDLLALLMGAGMLGLLIYKAFTAGFTHDESFTVLLYLDGDWMSILNNTPGTANNHLLHTLLMKLVWITGWHQEGALRLPNLIAGAFFFWFTWKIARSFGRGWLVPAGFLLMVANPYLVDFFALARGYGMLLACLSGTIYHFLRWTEKGWTSHYRKALVWALLAVLSNFTALPFFLLLIFWHNAIRWLDLRFDQPIEHRSFLRHNWFNLIMFAVMAALVYEPLRKIIKGGRLWFGGENSFWGETVRTLAEGFGYGTDYSEWINQIFPWVMLGIFAMALLMVAFVFVQRNSRHYEARRKLLFVTGLLSFLILWSVSQNLLLDTPYLVFRTALSYYFVFTVVLVALLDRLASYFPVPVIFVGSIIALAFGFHMIWVYQPNHYRDWYFDASTGHALQLLEEQTEAGETADLSVSWLLQPTTEFYRIGQSFDWIPVMDRDGPSSDSEFWLIVQEDLSLVNFTEDDVIYKNEESGTWLVRNPAFVRN